MPLANLIDGRAIAEQIHAETSQRIAALKQRGILPGLAFVRVGEDPASQVYVAMKERTSARLGIASVTRLLPEVPGSRIPEGDSGAQRSLAGLLGPASSVAGG